MEHSQTFVILVSDDGVRVQLFLEEKLVDAIVRDIALNHAVDHLGEVLDGTPENIKVGDGDKGLLRRQDVIVGGKDVRGKAEQSDLKEPS